MGGVVWGVHYRKGCVYVYVCMCMCMCIIMCVCVGGGGGRALKKLSAI